MSHIRNKTQNLKAIILVNNCDFGRCQLATRSPTCFWPVISDRALERLLRHLAENGLENAVICSNGLNEESLADAIDLENELGLEFLNLTLPVGTAGFIRDAAAGQTEGLLLVFTTSIVNPPANDVLINAHLKGESDLTVMLNPNDSDPEHPGQVSGIYICSPRIIEHIPKAGYCDIKEGLIPKMLISGIVMNILWQFQIILKILKT